MEALKAIYRILWALEKGLDSDKADISLFSAKTLGISQRRWLNYLLMLQKAGYIEGIVVRDFISGESAVNIDNIAITLDGLEYFASNRLMRRLYKVAQGAIAIIH